jgi:hypothetical protein
MKIKKSRFSTMISDLYGRDSYEYHIKVGREYWWDWPYDTPIGRKHGSGWYKIKVTYVRSHCMFYIFPDYPDVPEQFCGLGSFLASSLVLADLNPKMDLPFIWKEGLDISEKMYCFDDTRTIIHNWDNSQECEVDEDAIIQKDPIVYLTMLTHKQKSEA